MKIEKNIIIGIVGGIASVIAGVIFLVFFDSANIFYFLVGAGILIALVPFVLTSIMQTKEEREKDQKFIEFARALVESVESGTSISKSIINMKMKNFGSLTPYVKKLANQIELGIPIQEALRTFAEDTKSSTIIRSITLIREADKTGGNISTILESVAKSVTETEKLKEERRAAISSIVMEGYIIFFIFIIIMVVVEVQILPLTSGITGISSPTFGSDTVANGLDVSEYSIAFLSLLIAQGFFAGLIIGKISEGKVRAGIKHSFIMVAMAILISTGSKIIF